MPFSVYQQATFKTISMYISPEYQMDKPEEILGFMRQYNFACMVSSLDNKLVATHLPFLLQHHEDELVLFSHLAKANPQAEQLENQEVLVIFSEPHAYISPTWYTSSPNVPTWNYVAVHAYGQIRVLDAQATLELMEKTVQHFEPTHKANFWDNLPPNYRKSLLEELVAFELTITRIDAKKKLNQGKKKEDQENVIQALKATQEPLAVEIARLMQKEMMLKGL
jgi:transcriptional regulator